MEDDINRQQILRSSTLQSCGTRDSWRQLLHLTVRGCIRTLDDFVRSKRKNKRANHQYFGIQLSVSVLLGQNRILMMSAKQDASLYNQNLWIILSIKLLGVVYRKLRYWYDRRLPELSSKNCLIITRFNSFVISIIILMWCNYNSDSNRIPRLYEKMLEELITPDHGFTLVSANRLFGEKTEDFEEQFIRGTEKYYGAPLMQVQRE